MCSCVFFGHKDSKDLLATGNKYIGIFTHTGLTVSGNRIKKMWKGLTQREREWRNKILHTSSCHLAPQLH